MRRASIARAAAARPLTRTRIAAAAIAAAAAVCVLLAARAARAQDRLRPDEHARRGAQTSVGDGPSAFGNALRLARLLNDDATVARLLRMRAASPTASMAEVASAVEALEAIGRPGEALAMLADRVRARPAEVAARVALAELQARSGNARAAAQTWKAVDERFGLNTAHANEYARVLSRIGDIDGAYKVLKRARAKAEPDAKEFWEALGELAWETGDDLEALLAYRKLWALAPSPVAGERLMTLTSESGNVDEAIAVALEVFKSSGGAHALLFAADLQRKRNDWPAVKRTLSLADLEPSGFVGKEEYWLLRGEAFEHLGEPRLARDAYEAALRIDPGSVTAKAALLWHSLEDKDLGTLRRRVEDWRNAAEAEPEMWAPYAVALDKLGRTREALAFYARQLRHAPGDYLFVLEFADALERTGGGVTAQRMRQLAIAKLRSSVLAARAEVYPTPEQKRLVEMHAALTRRLAGAEQAERWLRSTLGARVPDAETEEFAIEWYMDSGRPELARWRMNRARARGIEPPSWRRYRLALALDDDDDALAGDLLARGATIDASDRIEALVKLERDDLAVPAIHEALEHGGAGVDTATLHRELDDARVRHAPYARAGGTYEYVTGLATYGPDAAVAHDAGTRRVIVSAQGRELRVDDQTLVAKTGYTLEADAGALVRSMTARSVTELGAWLNYQKGTPVPRAQLFDQRVVARTVALTVDLNTGSRIDDTAFLRLAAVRTQALANVRVELPARLYASAELETHEDTTRELHHLGAEVEGTVEAGYRILTQVPEWDVALQGIASGRANVRHAVPNEVFPLIPKNANLDLLLPPSYGLVSAVTHFVRGDFLERYRPDRGSFPRYDCEAGVGVLVPDRDVAVHAQCALGMRTSAGGYVNAVGLYRRGVAGIDTQTNAIASISYTLTF